MHKNKWLLDFKTIYYFPHSLFGANTTLFCSHKIQYFSIRWRLSCVTWLTKREDRENMTALNFPVKHLYGLYDYVFEWFDRFIIHHSHIGVKFMETITSQLYQALTHAMRIIPWLWPTTPLRGSWKITSLQSEQVQAPTSVSRTRCPRSPSVHSELHFSEPVYN